jgi:hypothetical protein
MGITRIHVGSTLPRNRMLMSFYHPMRNLRNPINVYVTNGFVSMSDMFKDVCIFVTLMFPFCISS